MKLRTSLVNQADRRVVVACDGQCHKAWGIVERPKIVLGGGDDDTAFMADGELGEAPQLSSNWEGGFNKPGSFEKMNRWCTRQCERSDTFGLDQRIVLKDFSVRLYNQPWLHLDVLQKNSHPQLEAARDIAKRMAAGAVKATQTCEGFNMSDDKTSREIVRETLLSLRNLARKSLQRDHRHRPAALREVADGLSALADAPAMEGEDLFARHSRIEAMMRLMMAASEAMNQSIVDQTNLLEDIADSIDKIVAALPPGSPIAPVFIGHKPVTPTPTAASASLKPHDDHRRS